IGVVVHLADREFDDARSGNPPTLSGAAGSDVAGVGVLDDHGLWRHVIEPYRSARSFDGKRRGVTAERFRLRGVSVGAPTMVWGRTAARSTGRIWRGRPPDRARSAGAQS